MGAKQVFLIVSISIFVLILSAVLFLLYTRPRTESMISDTLNFYNNPVTGLSFSYLKEWGEVKMPSSIGYFTNNSKVSIEMLPIEYGWETETSRDADSPSCLLTLNKPLLFGEERKALNSTSHTESCVNSYSLIPVDDPRHARCEITTLGDPSQKVILRWYELNPSCGGSVVEGPTREVKSFTFYSPTQRVELRLDLKSYSYENSLEDLNNFDFAPYFQHQENVVGKEILNTINQFETMAKTVRIIK